jgi:transposase InsO family protein
VSAGVCPVGCDSSRAVARRYPATWLNRYWRKIIGFGAALKARSTCMRAGLNTWAAKPLVGLVSHSNQGSHSSATNFLTLLAHHQGEPRRSRRGTCYANAAAESVGRRLKVEMLNRAASATHGSPTENQLLARLLLRRTTTFGLRLPRLNHSPPLCGLGSPPYSPCKAG